MSQMGFTVGTVSGQLKRVVVMRFKYQADLRAGMEKMVKEQKIRNAVFLSGIGSMRNLVVHFNHPRISDFLRKMDLYTSQDAPLLARQGRGGLRNRPAGDPTAWTFVRGPLGVFWNRYVRHRGFLDGVHGLVAAALLAAYQFFETAKLWEHLHAPPDAPGAGAAAGQAGEKP